MSEELPTDPISLLPCPFCGGKAQARVDSFRCYAVFCIANDCEASLGDGIDPCGDADFSYSSKEDAADAWNRRSSGGATVEPEGLDLLRGDQLRRLEKEFPEAHATYLTLLRECADAILARNRWAEQCNLTSEREANLLSRLSGEPSVEPVPHIGVVTNNNLDGWNVTVETAPNVTLPVGTKVYTEAALIAVGAGVAEEIWKRESSGEPGERQTDLMLSQAARLLREYEGDAHAEDVQDVSRWLAVYDARFPEVNARPLGGPAPCPRCGAERQHGGPIHVCSTPTKVEKL